ncbi:ABC-F family ATP-binding cassette domain-containing protein [Nitriliruptoraceae bacterium ZYF776]|nr:ABC-F family ATP-binding cassette domain-containing protein [Profundirhabdus halotolerans]
MRVLTRSAAAPGRGGGRPWHRRRRGRRRRPRPASGPEGTVPSIHLHHVRFGHTSAATTLDAADLDLDATGGPWIGVVAPNGAGKSTLLRLIAGELTPTAGNVDVHADAPPRLVPQTVAELADDVRAFACDWDGAPQKLRARLELDPDDLDPSLGRGWDALSPGQRKRWQVAAALADAPDVLLLDEPTNHLDVAARDLLLAVLEEFVGLALLVSHDRALLDHLTTRTVRIHRGGLELHAGPYSDASARWRAEEAAVREAHVRARREVRHERRILAEVRRDRHSAEVGPRRQRRLAGASQPDARESVKKFAQQKAEGALARRVAQSRARVERAEAAEDGFELDRDHAGTVAFRHEATGRRVLAMVTGDVPHAGGAPWLHDVEVALHRGERVHLAGHNGAGKTTLLRAVLAQLERTDEVVGRLDQELDDPAAEVERIRQLDPTARGRVLGTVATLGVDPTRVLVTDAPSPGEARKLAMARSLAADGIGVLVLDEPTNHLDLPSIERLEDALVGFPGAILLVTHDERLAADVTTTRWEVADRRVQVTTGTVDPGPSVGAG